MYALTIKQPWASLIMAGLKRVENRTWRTNYRGPLAIHAGRTVDRDAAETLDAAGIDPQDFEDAPRGVILGVVDLIDVIEMDSAAARQQALPGFPGRYDIDSDPLATGPYCWILRNPRPLARPVPYCGRRNLWDVTPDEFSSTYPGRLSVRATCRRLPGPGN